MKVFVLFICLLITAEVAGQPANKLKRIAVKGNRFVTSGDSTVFLKGLNTSDPEKLFREQRWNQTYFQAIKNWGSNVIRFPVHPQAWRKLGKSAYLNVLDEGVRFAAEEGLYVIIDWHSIGNLCTEQFTHPMYQTTKAETFDFWQTIANRYKNNTTVAFFELFNEPTTDNGKLGPCNWQDWKKVMEDLIDTIRNTGARTIPLVAGFNWAYDLTPIKEYPLDAEEIGYISHPYPQKRPKPWEDQWTADWGFAAGKYPLILTEIGFCGPEDKGAHIPVISDESYGDAITAYCESKGISYVVWVFDINWSPMLISDWNFTPTRQGRYFKEALRNAAK